MRECGRSMVEMLGVLAIIGVLSVGAIYGYSKAMMKYKLNKQAEVMNMLLHTVVQLNLPYSDDWHTKLISRLNLLPDGIKQSSSEDYLHDMFGNSIWIFSIQPETNFFGYGIGYNFTEHGDRNEICRNLLNVYRANSSFIYTINTDNKYQDEETDNSVFENFGYYYGDNYCIGNRKCIRDITISDIDNMCHQCDVNSTQCRIYVLF